MAGYDDGYVHYQVHREREGPGRSLQGPKEVARGKMTGILRPVLRIRIRIHMFLGLLDPDTSVRGIDLDPAPDPSITMQKK